MTHVRPVAPRVYTRNGGGNFSRSVEYDDVTINGTVIPEPASFALAGLGGVMLLGHGRRRA